jgi:hypothetical protein
MLLGPWLQSTQYTHSLQEAVKNNKVEDSDCNKGGKGQKRQYNQKKDWTMLVGKC